ncbi:DUF4181 domain-containing protein [Rossellomorea aquimaris]|uniref:DUF4181 domain-containing protein n=1 Tax=Rossellomorea aquimaris TaxID=189382 RepID=UPI001CD6C4F0|nr:DUF4181 domain-containing protein [Rossellomorea aquimaris]MCA1054014.1 DUF4181 domain-containing protein [Rossellomorea aquimaris]
MIFILKLLLVIGLYIGLMFLFHRVTSSLLGLEKRKMFEEEFVNEKHRKWDKWIRTIAAIVMVTGFFLVVVFEPSSRWYFQPYFIISVFYVAIQLLKAYMEWKHQENKRESAYTLMEIGLTVILLVLLFSSNFLIF